MAKKYEFRGGLVQLVDPRNVQEYNELTDEDFEELVVEWIKNNPNSLYAGSRFWAKVDAGVLELAEGEL